MECWNLDILRLLYYSRPLTEKTNSWTDLWGWLIFDDNLGPSSCPYRQNSNHQGLGETGKLYSLETTDPSSISNNHKNKIKQKSDKEWSVYRTYDWVWSIVLKFNIGLVG